MKPRIRFIRMIGEYRCMQPGRWITAGFGNTPEEAYRDWKLRQYELQTWFGGAAR